MAKNNLLAPITKEEQAQLQADDDAAKSQLLAPIATEELAALAPPPTTADELETAARSTAEGLTLGLSEPVVSGGIALKNQIKQAMAEGSLDPLAIDNFVKNYEQDVQQRLIQKAQNPGLDIGGQVVGAIAPTLLTGGAALGVRGAAALAKGAKAIDVGAKLGVAGGKMAAKPLLKAAQLAEGTKAAGTAKLAASAAENAAGAVAQEAARQGVLKSTGFMKPGEGPDFDEVALLGGALPVVGSGVGAITRGAKVAGRGAMKVFLGASDDKIDNYLKNYEVLQKARDIKEIENAARGNLAFLKQAAPKAEDALATDVLDHLDILGTRTSQASAEAFELLEKSGQSFDSDALIAAVDKAKKELLTGQSAGSAPKKGWLTGTVNWFDETTGRGSILGDDGNMYRIQDFSKRGGPITKEAKVSFALSPSSVNPIITDVAPVSTSGGALVGAANKNSYAKLESLQKDIQALGDQMGGKIPAGTTKEIIQALDQEYNELARGEFATTAATAVNKARRNINEVLKTVEGYADKMKEVSALADLRKRVFQEFGGSEKKALAGVKAALNGNLPRQRLLDEFAQSQPIGLAQAQEAKRFAEQVNLLNESNIGDKLSLFVKGSNDPKLRDQLQKLADLSDQGLMTELQALRANEAFNKGFLQGSRNVNMWTVLGAAAKDALLGGKALTGAAVGMTISPGLAAVGAAWGATVDLYGPQMARSILKGMMQIKGIPTVAKIRALDIPEDTKRLMIQDLARAMRPVVVKDKAEERQLNSFYAPEQSRPVIASEIRRASGLSPEQKAEMINTLNKTGKVVDFDKVVFANEDKRPSQPSLVKDKAKKPPVPSDAVEQYFEYKKRMPY